MNRFFPLLIALSAPLCLCGSLPAAEPIRHRILVCEYPNQRIVELSPEGKLTWEHKTPSITVIFDLYPNGDLIYAYGGNPTGVQRITRDHKIVLNYISKCPQVLGVQALPNGHALVGEQGPPQAIEIDEQGKVIHTTSLTTSEQHFHRQIRHLAKLPTGNILVCHEAEGAVREYTPDGKVVWEYIGAPDTFQALRRLNGHTLIACGTAKRIIEVNPEGRIIWEFGSPDAPDLNLAWITSLQELKNGNIIACNFLRGHEGKGAHAFEVTPDKKIVWTFSNHQLIKTCTEVRVIDD